MFLTGFDFFSNSYSRNMFFYIQKSTITMDSTLVALFFLFHVLSVGTGNPLPDAKNTIEPIIKTLMVRLNAFQVCFRAPLMKLK